MKSFGHFSLFCAIVVCGIFTVFLFTEPTPVAGTSTWTPTFTQPPAYPVDPAQVASAALQVPDPFQPKFFATARFKGITRTNAGNFAAIFLDGANRVVQLSVGDSLGGITLVEATPAGCRVLIGSTSRLLPVRTP